MTPDASGAADPLTAAFARWLRTWMAGAQVSNRALAKRLGVDPATVSQWRRGTFLPSDENLSAIARAGGSDALRYRASEARRGSLIHAAMTGGPEAAAALREERLYLSRFRLALVTLDASEAVVVAAEELVTAPQLPNLFAALGIESTSRVEAMTWLGNAIEQLVDTSRATLPSEAAPLGVRRAKVTRVVPDEAESATRQGSAKRRGTPR